MTAVRAVVHPGWLVVQGPSVDAVIAAAEGDAEPLEAAAADGLVALLEALTAPGLAAAPGFVACARVETGLRVVLRGGGVVVLPDGTRVGAEGRMPWLDVDLDLAPDEVGEVVIEAAPPPPRSRGWQRPARLRRGSDEADPPALPAPVSALTELLPVAGADVGPDAAPASDGGPEPDVESPATSDEPTSRVRTTTLEVPSPTTTFPPADVAPPSSAASGDEPDGGPVVPGVLCPAGHPSPPLSRRCRTCDREIAPQQPVPVPRPSLGVLRLSTGGSVSLDRGVLLGRAPRLDEDLPAGARPHVLRVGGPDRDISRNHAEVVLEGWQVLVRDLGSTNGTTVTLPGEEPVRLRPNEARAIEPGTVVSLAGEVVLSYEVPD